MSRLVAERNRLLRLALARVGGARASSAAVRAVALTWAEGKATAWGRVRGYDGEYTAAVLEAARPDMDAIAAAAAAPGGAEDEGETDPIEEAKKDDAGDVVGVGGEVVAEAAAEAPAPVSVPAAPSQEDLPASNDDALAVLADAPIAAASEPDKVSAESSANATSTEVTSVPANELLAVESEKVVSVPDSDTAPLQPPASDLMSSPPLDLQPAQAPAMPRPALPRRTSAQMASDAASAAAAVTEAAVAAANAAAAPRSCVAMLRTRVAPRLVSMSLALHPSPGVSTAGAPLVWTLSWHALAAVGAGASGASGSPATDFLALHDLSSVTLRYDATVGSGDGGSSGNQQHILSCRLAPDRLHLARYCGGLLQLDLVAPPPAYDTSGATGAGAFVAFAGAVCAAARSLGVPVIAPPGTGSTAPSAAPVPALGSSMSAAAAARVAAAAAAPPIDAARTARLSGPVGAAMPWPVSATDSFQALVSTPAPMASSAAVSMGATAQPWPGATTTSLFATSAPPTPFPQIFGAHGGGGGGIGSVIGGGFVVGGGAFGSATLGGASGFGSNHWATRQPLDGRRPPLPTTAQATAQLPAPSVGGGGLMSSFFGGSRSRSTSLY